MLNYLIIVFVLLAVYALIMYSNSKKNQSKETFANDDDLSALVKELGSLSNRLTVIAGKLASKTRPSDSVKAASGPTLEGVGLKNVEKIDKDEVPEEVSKKDTKDKDSDKDKSKKMKDNSDDKDKTKKTKENFDDKDKTVESFGNYNGVESNKFDNFMLL